MDENKLMMLFLSEELGTNDPKKIQNYLKGLDENKQKALATKYQLWKEAKKKKQATKAAHGAKLDYVKSLKHICPEGEELVYFKQGGSVGCGCKKKEDGGEVVKANMGVVANFRKDLKKKQQQLNQQLQKPKWTDVEDNELKKLSEKKNPTPQEKQKLQQLRNKFKNSSNTKDYEVEEGKKGMKVEKDCGGSSIVKKFKAKCGSKMKKHQLGGSLNRIPFYLEGTPKSGITLYLPKRPISGAEAYMNDAAINDPDYKKYNNKANAYSNEAPTISNTFNNVLNRLKASYYGSKAALKGYYDEADRYSRDLWSRGNYGEAIFGSPFVPIVRSYKANKPFMSFIDNK